MSIIMNLITKNIELFAGFKKETYLCSVNSW